MEKHKLKNKEQKYEKNKSAVLKQNAATTKKREKIKQDKKTRKANASAASSTASINLPLLGLELRDLDRLRRVDLRQADKKA